MNKYHFLYSATLNKKIKHMYIFLDINDVTEFTTIIDPKKNISAVTTG